jgi:hypothetical protein
VATGSASSISTSSAVLHGTINPQASTTTYFFQWGLTTGYGAASASHTLTGTKSVNVATTASGLIPGTTYHYRVVAVNSFGTSTGADRTFKTSGHPPPGAITGPATGLGPTYVTLTGTVVPNGEATQWLFQYGLNTAYGTDTAGGTVPNSGPVTVVQSLQGLAPQTVFHYRLLALHSGSVVGAGGDQVFMTYPSVRPFPQVRASTSPDRARFKPFVFTTTGSVVGPRSVLTLFACRQAGTATLSYFWRKHQVAVITVPVQQNCTFAATAVFAHRFGTRKQRRHREHLTIVSRWNGNGYLAPTNARNEHVTMG